MLGSPVVERAQATPPSLDLRRGFRRDLAETLVERAAHLPAHDRMLVEAVFREGRSISELSRLWGDPPPRGRSPRSLRRRLRKLVERLLSPGYVVVAQHLGRWSPGRRRVATACVLHGKSLREAAESLGMTLHSVRRHFEAVNAVVDAVSGGVS